MWDTLSNGNISVPSPPCHWSLVRNDGSRHPGFWTQGVSQNELSKMRTCEMSWSLITCLKLFQFFCKKKYLHKFCRHLFLTGSQNTFVILNPLCCLFRENITNGCFLKSILATSCCVTFVTFLVLTCPKKIQEQSHFNAFSVCLS